MNQTYIVCCTRVMVRKCNLKTILSRVLHTDKMMLTTQKKCTSENVLIHLGYHKTASTWFQKALFAESKFGFQMSQQNRSHVHAAFCTPLISNHPENKHVNSIVNEANEVTSSGKIFVLSHERLSGYPASGGFDSINIAYA